MIEPNFSTLRAVLKLPSNGSISKATAELGLTQSAVSRPISDPGESFDTCPVATDPLVALLPVGHDMKSPLAPHDLSQMPFIMAQGGSQPHILNWFRQAQVALATSTTNVVLARKHHPARSHAEM